MNFQLASKERIPLILYMDKKRVISELQSSTLKPDGNFKGYYFEYSHFERNSSEEAFGKYVFAELMKYNAYGDMTQEEIYNKTGMTREEHNEKMEVLELDLAEVKTLNQLYQKYLRCSIRYHVLENRYELGLSWLKHKGKELFFETASSTGKPGLLTFPTPLEFDSTIAPETLGRMVLEAFDRCQQLTDAAAGNKFEVKELTLFDDSVLEIQMPRDKHFFDSGDMGTAEIYQMYEYFPKEDAEDAQAQFFLGIGEELNCDISQDNITAVWESNYGKAEFQEIKAVKQSIYCLRAELRNKTIHKVSYFVKQNEELLLECSMEVFQPGKRKKLEEKLLELFEEFAGRCRRKCC